MKDGRFEEASCGDCSSRYCWISKEIESKSSTKEINRMDVPVESSWFTPKVEIALIGIKKTCELEDGTQ